MFSVYPLAKKITKTSNLYCFVIIKLLKNHLVTELTKQSNTITNIKHSTVGQNFGKMCLSV